MDSNNTIDFQSLLDLKTLSDRNRGVVIALQKAFKSLENTTASKARPHTPRTLDVELVQSTTNDSKTEEENVEETRLDASHEQHETDGEGQVPVVNTVASISTNISDAAQCTEAEVVATAAPEIRQSIDLDYGGPEGYENERRLDAFWWLLLGLVKKMPARDARQEILVKVLAELNSDRDNQQKGLDTPWHGLWCLGAWVRDKWDCEYY